MRMTNASTLNPAKPSGFFWLLPGFVLTAAIAAIAFGFRQLPGVAILSPLILAIVVGAAIRNTWGMPAGAQAGVTFSARRLLRFAIILLGLQLSLAQVMEVGYRGLLALAVVVLATMAFSRWFGRRIGVSPQLTDLIAAGTSICGASAVLAMNTVTRASDEDAAYAVASVTIFGTIAMFAYPAMFHLLSLSDTAYGFWAGASVHEVAQVIAAAFQADEAAGKFGTIVKLTRVMMLAPLVLGMGAMAFRQAGGEGAGRAMPPMPWFVVGFACAVALNSLITITPDVRAWLMIVTTFLLSMALGGLGLEIHAGKLKAQGLRPLVLGLASTVFIAVLSYGAARLVY
jgi:uncharacterized integral membrane protein (TIGR00698 family)